MLSCVQAMQGDILGINWSFWNADTFVQPSEPREPRSSRTIQGLEKLSLRSIRNLPMELKTARDSQEYFQSDIG